MKNWMYRHLRAPPSAPDSRKPTWWKEQEYSSFQNITFIRSRLRPMYRSVSIAVLPIHVSPHRVLLSLLFMIRCSGYLLKEMFGKSVDFITFVQTKLLTTIHPSSLEIPRVFLLRPLSIKRQDRKGGTVGDQYLDNLD